MSEKKTSTNPLHTPPYPKPLSKKEAKKSLWHLYKRGLKSTIHTLYEGSYKNAFSTSNILGRIIHTPKKPSMIKQIMRKKYEHYPKHQLMHEMLKPLLGESIFTTNGEVWKRQRRIMDAAFERAGTKKVFPVMIEAIEDMQQRMQEHSEKEVFDMDFAMTHVTADVIMRTILSSPIQDKEALEIFHHFVEFQEKAGRMQLLFGLHLPFWSSPYDYYIWKKRGKQIRKVIGDIIQARYQEFKQKKGDTNYGDILEAMMQSEDPETKTSFNDKELIDHVVMLFLAGHETSASALSWTFDILSHCEKHTEAIAVEAYATFDSLSNIRFSQVHQLKLARDVFRETLRLYPPVPLLSRASTQADKLDEKNIAQGEAVNINTWILHRHEKLWSQPHQFKPERFKENEHRKEQGSYLPFSMGPRVCIGQAFAMQEALLIISSVCREFHLLPDPDHIPDPIARLTLRSQNGIKLFLKKRSEPPTGKAEFSAQSCPEKSKTEKHQSDNKNEPPSTSSTCPFA